MLTIHTCVVPTGLAVLSALLLPTMPAGARQEQPAQLPPEQSSALSSSQPLVTLAAQPELEFDLKLGLWQPRLGGDFGLNANIDANRIAVDEDLQLDNSESLFNVELSMRHHSGWQMAASGFSFETTRTTSYGALNPAPVSAAFGTLTLDPGDVVTASVEMTTAGFELGRTIWRPLADPDNASNINRHGRPIADFRFTPSLGLRVADIQASITEVGVGTAGASMTTAAIMLGIDLAFAFEPDEPIAGFIRSFEVEAFGSVGPALGGQGVVGEIRAGISAMFTPNIGVTLGYRLLEFRVSDGPFSFDSGLQGLFVGGRVTF